MGRKENLIASFLACKGTFSWRKFTTLLGQLGYEEYNSRGKTSGSRVKFIHPKTKHIIMAHAPHKDQMGALMVKRMKEELVDKGVL